MAYVSFGGAAQRVFRGGVGEVLAKATREPTARGTKNMH
jgi:hypothetical protein